MITLFEMHARPGLSYTRPHQTGMLLRLDEPSTGFYRHLHEQAGTPRSRERVAALDDEALFAYLTDPAIEVFVLFLGGAPAGFFEIDRREEGVAEVVHVGLTAGFQGRGLGKYLVATAVEAAWGAEPDLVWTSAGEDDDPRGLLLYQWAGFVAVGTRDEEDG